MRYCVLLPVPSANRSRESNWDCRDASRPFLLPPDHDAGFTATVLPPPYVASTSLPPPPYSQPLQSHSSVPPPMPSLPFANESYLSLAFSPVSLPCSMPPMLPPASQSNLNAAAIVAWDAADRDILLKAASRQRFTKVSGSKIRALCKTVSVKSLELEISLKLDNLFQVWQIWPHLVDVHRRRKIAASMLRMWWHRTF